MLDAAEVKHGLRKVVEITFKNRGEYGRFCGEEFEFEEICDKEQRVNIIVEDADVNKFLQVIVNYEVIKYVEKPVTLEEYFMHFYKNERKFGGVANA